MSLKSNPADWTDPRHRKGWEGELKAARFLAARGWEILARRFRMGRLEIDLVARRDTLVSFVEVKTRFGRSFGSPLEAVTAAKKREIIRVAQAWTDRYGQTAYVYRFDVIGVTLEGGGRWRVQHVEDAFRVGWR